MRIKDWNYRILFPGYILLIVLVMFLGSACGQITTSASKLEDNPALFSLVTVAVSSILLLIVIYFTHPGLRRLAGALIGGSVFAALNVMIAYYAGWWQYPVTEDIHAPWLFYAGAGLFYGAAVALIGWRINRRFRVYGLLIFILLMSILGAIRDFSYASSTNLLVFGTGIMPVIADWSAWAMLFLLTQLVMRLIAGPAKTDRLARSKEKAQ
jgi:hypothetical protein